MPSSQSPPRSQLEVTILGAGYFRFFLNLSKVKRCPGLIHCNFFDVLSYYEAQRSESVVAREPLSRS